MYADDSTIHSAALTSSELEKVLNEELELIKKWFDWNKLVLNVEKKLNVTKTML